MTSVTKRPLRPKRDQRWLSHIALAMALVALVLGAGFVTPAAQADSVRHAGNRVNAHRVTRLPTRPSQRATRQRHVDRVPARPGRGHADRAPARPGHHREVQRRIRDFRH